jgi:antitoxin component of MazEF toxin-antitoxin module/predicted transport protein
MTAVFRPIKTRILKYGNSGAIVIPQVIMEQIGLDVGDHVLVPFHEFQKTVSTVSTKIEPQTDTVYTSTESFYEKLADEEKQIVDSLIDGINKFGDNRIRVEKHKQHIAFKFYGDSRSKSWIVIKKVKEGLYVFLKVNEQSFKDPKGLSRPYNDIMAHGNRYALVNKSSDLQYLMYLIQQSYEFRKQSDYEKIFKAYLENKRRGE